MEWLVNKQNKVPLYLQLRDLVKYSISTGALQHSEQLPTVHRLAQQLGVNFETVRKAYKDLEREGLVSTERGVGTFVKGHVAAKLVGDSQAQSPLDPAETLRRGVHELFQRGRTAVDIKSMAATIVDEVAQEGNQSITLFAECNTLQAHEIAAVLRDSLRLDVRPVLLSDLSVELERIRKRNGLPSIITTGFHMNEVRRIVGSHSIPIDFVMTNMSPETRRRLDAYPKSGRFGFICRDPESKEFYPELLKAELGIKRKIASCLITEQALLADLLESMDVLLVAPSVYEAVKKMARPRLPVFNIQDRVDPLSLKMLKDRVTPTAMS